MISDLKLKICGISDRKVADLALELGVDYLGCILFPKSPRFVNDEKAIEVFSSLPKDKRVAVAVRPTGDELKKILDLPFDYYQFHFDPLKDLNLVEEWVSTISRERLWLAPKISPEQTFPMPLLKWADLFVIDSYKKDQFGGTGSTGSWDRFQEFSNVDPSKEWVLAGGLSPDNVIQAVEQTGAKFVDVNSGVESSPGVKSVEKIKELCIVLKSAMG